MSSKKITSCAISIALAVITGLITVYRLPFGGSVTLCSMLFVMLPAWMFGAKTGIACGIAYGLIRFLIEPYFLTVPQFLLDYIFAFGIMGIGGVFHDRQNGIVKGYILAIFGRWVMATAAGIIWVQLGMQAWEGWDILPYSMAYNGAYILIEGTGTMIILLIAPVRKALDRIKISMTG